MNNITLAVNICTYHRKEYIEKNISKLLSSKFFTDRESRLFGRMYIFVVDNGSDISVCDTEYLHVFHNRNTGGAGGFQRGLEEIRRFSINFSHVIFMDDDIKFEVESFYILFDFLRIVDEAYADYPVAGRMFCMDKPDIQYTAAEVWNQGKLKHIEYMRQVTAENYHPGRVVYDSGADYGGWWFCCFPMTFARENDILPFFIHCDDVEYGLRCGKPPIIIEGVQVWHETFDQRMSPLIRYYDTRNPLFVNELYHLEPDPQIVLAEWKSKITEFHVQKEWLVEYYAILAMRDYLRGLNWLKRIDSGKYHKRLQKVKSCRLKNAISWRIVERRYRKKYNLVKFL